MRFRANENFASEELKSDYVAGLFYTVRPEDLILAKLVQVWRREGKISLMAAAAAELSGTAEVKS